MARSHEEKYPDVKRKLDIGLNILSRRKENGYTLEKLSEISGVSVSCINDAEKCKKIPRLDSLDKIAKGLGLDRASLAEGRGDTCELARVVYALRTTDFPYKDFGIDLGNILDILQKDPFSTGNLLKIASDVADNYSLKNKDFLYACVRHVQARNKNYFETIENEARKFRKTAKWRHDEIPTLHELEHVADKVFGISIDDIKLKDLCFSGTRSVYQRRANTLFINPFLGESQKRFVIARELGYHVLNIAENRCTYSPNPNPETYIHIFNNFQASYFAGALNMPKYLMQKELDIFANQTEWNSTSYLNIMKKFNATPETFTYRMTELLPWHLDLDKIHFLKFTREEVTLQGIESNPKVDIISMTKIFNMSDFVIPTGSRVNEYLCRRWGAVRALDVYTKAKKPNLEPIAYWQLSRQSENLYFCISTAYAFQLKGIDASVTLGIKVDKHAKDRIRFLAKICKDVEPVELGPTCERCSISGCNKRQVDPYRHRSSDSEEKRNHAIKNAFSED